MPAAVAVGYTVPCVFVFGSGGSSQRFIVPGVGGPVVAWCDCLGDDFSAPLWIREDGFCPFFVPKEDTAAIIARLPKE